jgi:hypothetical protein
MTKFLIALSGVLVLICILIFLSFCLIALIAFLPDNSSVSWLSASADVGTMFAGLGTLGLAIIAYRAYQEWKRQLGAQYAHDCIIRTRKAHLDFNQKIRDFCQYIKDNEALLFNKEDKNENIKEVLHKNLREYQLSHTEFFDSLKHIDEISGNRNDPEKNELIGASYAIQDLCWEIIHEEHELDLEWIINYDKEHGSYMKDIFDYAETNEKDITSFEHKVKLASSFAVGFSSTLTKYAKSDFEEVNHSLLKGK